MLVYIWTVFWIICDVIDTAISPGSHWGMRYSQYQIRVRHGIKGAFGGKKSGINRRSGGARKWAGKGAKKCRWTAAGGGVRMQTLPLQRERGLFAVPGKRHE
ncbi:hypothetical protein DFH09DRAFT_1081057 [Mycena vulgaris]|nr:hypothetical protein DFH09DRAFT_1081057 [Mycena vulgaris]